MNSRVALLPWLLCFFLPCWPGLRAAQMEVLEFSSPALKANPLGDPATRAVALFSPDASSAGQPMQLLIYLPGWGGSSEDAIAGGRGGWLGQAVDTLAAQGHRLRIAVVDGRSRYGGSQFLNSSATGRYADYVSEELRPFLLEKFPSPNGCWIGGHSSGAYGALILAMREQNKFAAVVALSPDSDFAVTHRPLVEAASVRAVTAAELDGAMAPAGKARMPVDGLARLVLGLCANYAPIPGKPRQFEWLYDANGRWRPEAWQRWLALDPLSLVRENPEAFAPAQRIYLDGAEHDEFGANIGAGKIHAILKGRPAPAEFYESPGHHSDRLKERLVRGIDWVIKAGPAGRKAGDR